MDRASGHAQRRLKMAAAPFNYSLRGKRVWVAGHRGLLGSALVRRLASEDCEPVFATHEELDLRESDATDAWAIGMRPHVAIISAAKVGGILAHAREPVAFLRTNLLIAANTLEAAHRSGVERLLFLGSSCIYPKHAPQPITEDSLLSGALEPTNEGYAIAKIAGLKLCEAYRLQYGADFISAMPTNLYGPYDRFDPNTSHVVPALLQRIHAAKLNGDAEVTVWGSGSPRREFLHVDDCADACVHLLKTYSEDETINVGSGEDLSIRELATLIAEVVGYTGDLVFDRTKPDGTPRKLLDVSRLRGTGWSPGISLRQGLGSLYSWWLHQHSPSANGASALHQMQ